VRGGLLRVFRQTRGAPSDCFPGRTQNTTTKNNTTNRDTQHTQNNNSYKTLTARSIAALTSPGTHAALPSSQRMSTLVLTLLTFWPPGPLERANANSTSSGVFFFFAAVARRRKLQRRAVLPRRRRAAASSAYARAAARPYLW
jgi:hypothetical protein